MAVSYLGEVGEVSGGSNITLTADVAAGTSLIMVFGFWAGGSPSPGSWSATDPEGNTWTNIVGEGGNAAVSLILACQVASPLTTGQTITVTPSAGYSAANTTGFVDAFTGLDVSTALDTASQSQGFGVTSASLTVAADGFAYIAAALGGGAVGATWSATGGAAEAGSARGARDAIGAYSTTSGTLGLSWTPSGSAAGASAAFPLAAPGSAFATTLWDGTAEAPASISMWDGTTETPVEVAERVPFDQEPTAPLLLGSSAGVTVDWDTDWNALLVNDGSKDGAVNNGLAAYRSYSSGSIVADFSATAASGDPARGVASMWSCKPSISQINNGSLDATFTAFFESIPAGHRFYGMMWHEPYDNLGSDFATSAELRDAQERVHGLLHTSDADTDLVSWGILLTAFDFQQDRHEQFFPSSGAYDWVGVDGYDFYRPPGAPDRKNYRTPGQIFGPCVDFAASVGKPVVVGEFSIHPDPAYPDGPMSSDGVPSRPYRLQDMLDYFDAQDVLAACMFHSTVGAEGPWWMDCFHNWPTPEDRSATDPDTLEKIRDLLAVYGRQ